MKDHQCQICQRIFTKRHGLMMHVHKSHNISSKLYYDTYFKKEGDGICKICGNNTTFNNTKGYSQYCSYKCRNNSLDRMPTLDNAVFRSLRDTSTIFSPFLGMILL